MEFEWDPKKAAANLAKHGVGFPEAMTVFADRLEVSLRDPDHSHGEFRFVSLGLADARRLVVVAYTERAGKVRIIHARPAAPRERRAYESAKTPEG